MERSLKQMNQNILQYFNYACQYSDDENDASLVTRLDDNINKLILRATALERELNITRTLGSEERKKLYVAMAVEDRGQDLKSSYLESLKNRDKTMMELYLQTENVRLQCELDNKGVPSEQTRNDDSRASFPSSPSSSVYWSKLLEDTKINLIHVSHSINMFRETMEHNKEFINHLNEEIEKFKVKQGAYEAILGPKQEHSQSDDRELQRQKTLSHGRSDRLPPVVPRGSAPLRLGLRTPPTQPANSPADEPMIIKASDLLKCQTSAGDTIQFHRLQGRKRSKQKKSPHFPPQPFPFQELYAQAKSGSMNYTNSLSMRQMELLAKQVGVSVHRSFPDKRR